jgi:hypothetical protein
MQMVRTFGLEQLALSAGTMTPLFSRDIQQYVVEVSAQTTSVTLRPDAVDPTYDLSMSIRGGAAVPLVNGQNSAPIALNAGLNTVTIDVRAQDGLLSKTYTLMIYRIAQSSSGGGGGYVSVSPDMPKLLTLGDELTVQRQLGDGNLKLTLAKLKEQTWDQGTVALSPVYEISVDPGQTARLTQPLTITIAFAASEAGRPSVFRYDEVASAWVELGGEVRADKIMVSATTAGKFAVLAMPTSGTNNAVSYTPSAWLDIQSHWAKQAIEKAADLGIVTGYADGTMGPDDTVTRAQFVAMLVRAIGLQGNPSQLDFEDSEDVPAWATTAVGLAVEAGILTGYADGTIRPNQQISRAEMAVMLFRGYGIDVPGNTDGTVNFTDEAQIPNWAKSSVTAATERSIFSGYQDGEFKPFQSATRAETVVVLLRMMNVK